MESPRFPRPSQIKAVVESSIGQAYKSIHKSAETVFTYGKKYPIQAGGIVLLTVSTGTAIEHIADNFLAMADNSDRPSYALQSGRNDIKENLKAIRKDLTVHPSKIQANGSDTNWRLLDILNNIPHSKHDISAKRPETEDKAIYGPLKTMLNDIPAENPITVYQGKPVTLKTFSGFQHTLDMVIARIDPVYSHSDAAVRASQLEARENHDLAFAFGGAGGIVIGTAIFFASALYEEKKANA